MTPAKKENFRFKSGVKEADGVKVVRPAASRGGGPEADLQLHRGENVYAGVGVLTDTQISIPSLPNVSVLRSTAIIKRSTDCFQVNTALFHRSTKLLHHSLELFSAGWQELSSISTFNANDGCINVPPTHTHTRLHRGEMHRVDG